MTQVGRDVAIVGVYATEQGRDLGRSDASLMVEALQGALDDAGMAVADIDGFFDFDFPAGDGSGADMGNIAFQLGTPMTIAGKWSGVPALVHAASAIRSGQAETVAIAFGGAQRPTPGSVADYTRPAYEFTEWTGSTTPAQMALQAKRHMHLYGTSAEQLAAGAAFVRNCGHNNPGAVMFDRGPYTVDDVLGARMIAEPFTLLMCSLVNDGGSCVLVTSADRARDCRRPPVWVLSGAFELHYRSYFDPPTLAPMESRARMLDAIARAGVTHADVDLVTPYDHFASGIVMELEAAGFCEIGEGGPFVVEQVGWGPGQLPISTDGGCLSYSHPKNPYNFKIIEAVRQLRNEVPDRCPHWRDGVHTHDRASCRAVPDPEVAVAFGPMVSGFSLAVLAR